MIELPVNQEGPLFGFATELDGVTYGLTFRWNNRVEQWVMDLSDGEGTLLVAGIRVVIDTPLLARYRGRANTPPGEMMAIDTSGQSMESDLEAIGRRVVLFYVEAAELQ